MIIEITFIIMALMTLGIFIYERQPFRIWAWPINAIVWCIISLLNKSVGA